MVMIKSVSVVVPTYRREKMLERCLSALLSQDYEPSAMEVIVVDDAASMETRRLVEQFAANQPTYQLFSSAAELIETDPAEEEEEGGDVLQATDRVTSLIVEVQGGPTLRYIPVTGRHGPAAARNLGWQSAQGEIIAFTDDDCIPWTTWVSAGVAAFRGDVAAVSGQVLVPIPEIPTDYEKDAAGLESADFVTANCFYRQSVLEQVGGFDEDFAMAWREDSDLYFRILQAGCTVSHAPTAIVIHPIRPAKWGVCIQQQRKSMYNALLYKKHPSMYRQHIQPGPPRLYYAIVAALLAALVSFLLNLAPLAWLSLAGWAYLTGRFAKRRLRDTSRRKTHIMEMVVTSAIIPVLAVFWRLWGAIRFRVLFI